ASPAPPPVVSARCRAVPPPLSPDAAPVRGPGRTSRSGTGTPCAPRRIESLSEGARLLEDLGLDRVGGPGAVGRLDPVPLPAGVVEQTRRVVPLSRLHRRDEGQAGCDMPLAVGARLLVVPQALLARRQVAFQTLAPRQD